MDGTPGLMLAGTGHFIEEQSFFYFQLSTGAEGGVDFGLHAGFGFGVDAGEEDVFPLREFGNFLKAGLAGELGGAYADDVAGDARVRGRGRSGRRECLRGDR
jgi:hypothetical protein